MWYRVKHGKRTKLHFSSCIMRIAAVLGCLTVISVYLLSGLYAKYSTSASDSDSAVVARWDVSVDTSAGNPSEFEFKVGEDKGEWGFSVTNNSEVAVEYDLILTFSEAVSANVELTLDGTAPSESGENYIKFVNAGIIAVGGGQKEHTLTIAVTDFSDRIKQNINIEIVARQVD